MNIEEILFELERNGITVHVEECGDSWRVRVLAKYYVNKDYHLPRTWIQKDFSPAQVLADALPSILKRHGYVVKQKLVRY